MKSLCTLLIAGFALGLVACAQVPAVAERPPAVPQEKIWVAQHWEDAANQLACPCHGAKYKQTGEIISGPQPKPLKQYKAKLDGDSIVVSIA